MDADAFADRFALGYQDVYLHAVRRVRDKRGQLTPETTAFLLHLAEAGPMTLTELSRHLSRAPSTLSEMVDHLAAKGLVRREPDPDDARRALIWLTAGGRVALADEMRVLDHGRLVRAAARLDPDRRALLAEALGDLVKALKTERPDP
ncbi:MarR family transcriptional regulator [Phenylobacterium sp.]|uniref:MarR family winged helix-turn-helix transcriptional regulator n=1 Tax=Phenylobacterium sp. TaxID=1871053 RepID=UPI0025EC222D|nr:MarR family transcriptional regulator [Phenylobacterium sp.]